MSSSRWVGVAATGVLLAAVDGCVRAPAGAKDVQLLPEEEAARLQGKEWVIHREPRALDAPPDAGRSEETGAAGTNGEGDGDG